jgi:hypothetical protein
MELRQSQAAGMEGLRGVASHFGVGHLVVRSGGVVYEARCGMVVVELRNHTMCSQEIPVMHRGRDAYVDPLSLVIQSSATPVKCRKRTPPRWKIGRKRFCGYPEIRPCNGPGLLPGHRRTNLLGTGKAAEPDPGEGASETQPAEEGDRDPTCEALEGLDADISRHWLGNYAGLESLPGIVGPAMMGVSAAEMMMSTAVRMAVLYTWRGPGPWMAAAVWSTAFQMITMPGRWALDWGQSQGEMMSRAMEAKVGGANLPIDGGGTGSNNRN